MSTNGHGHATAPPILLTIAGFDPCCGAGTAADLKTFAAHGCYGVAAITALTVQNTQGVEDVHNIPSATLKQLVALSQRKESLMAQIQEIDRQMMRVQRKFIVPSQSAATQAVTRKKKP